MNRQKRYVGNEKYFSSSSAGNCLRKIYFKVNKEDITDPIKPQNKRIMRLGTAVHTELEKAFDLFIESGQNEKYGIESIRMEEEVVYEELNVRGFYDLLIETKDGKFILVDFKTIGSFPWKLKVVGDKDNTFHEMQLGTYGLCIEKQYGKVDQMVLAYYNKDNSEMRGLKVSLSNMDIAYEFWKKAGEKTKFGANLPPLVVGESPSQSWECGYCEYKQLCIKKDIESK